MQQPARQLLRLLSSAQQLGKEPVACFGAGCRLLSAGPSTSGTSTSGSSNAPTGAATRGTVVGVSSRTGASETAPPFPRFLGFAGAIPFVSLTPAFVNALGLPGLVDQCAQAQLAYGGVIVSFLGAVHWGLAMGSTLGQHQAGLRERYTWSVFPSIAAVPALLMHPAQGSVAMSALLLICYLSDRNYASMGVLPSWYKTLRGQLTAIAMISLLATSGYYLNKDIEAAKRKIEAEDAAAAAAAATGAVGTSAPKKASA